ncbi:MAG: hypothetical protein GY842_16860 [bacterium]|nr:hypothetical protein [bacterium]
MFKTLGLLAVSMTGTTVLLARLEPAASAGVPYAFVESARQVVRAAVTGTPHAPYVSWHGVEIVSGLEVAPGVEGQLAAVPQTGTYHFWVGDFGDVSVTRAWSEQRPASGNGGIRIALEAGRSQAGIAPRQWAALRLLLEELRGLLADAEPIDAVAWDLRLSDHAAHDENLLSSLRDAGLLG